MFIVYSLIAYCVFEQLMCFILTLYYVGMVDVS